MTLFSVDIQKSLLTEFWTNRYIVDAANLEAARVVGQEIVAAERRAHKDNVAYDKMRVSTVASGDDTYVIEILSGFGTATFNGELLPLFNVVRVDFNTAVGRPSRKYLRAPIAHEDVDGFNLNAAYSAEIANGYVADMLAISEFVDVDGQAFVSAAVQNVVGMRQLRRGSRRRTEPVI